MFDLTIANRHRVQLESSSREAEGYLELGLHAQALRSLQRRGQLVHQDHHACYLMGECLRELSRYDEALYPLRRSAELNPNTSETWLAMGWCYKRSGKLDSAIESLEYALRHTAGASTSEQAILHYNLACYYSLAGRSLDALCRLKRAFDLDRALRDLVRDEPDFAPMRADPGFRMLMAAMA